MNSVLSKLKVLELASVLAGPAVGMYFAERGAKVIKVENKKSKGDVTRSWKLASENKDASISAYFCSVNWNKDYIFMDLSNPNERPALEDLIKQADIIISNFKSGDAEKFKLNFDSLKMINPKIIHAELSGFGSNNKRLAYDLVLQAETGFMFMNGTPESGPIKMPLALIDVLAAHQLKEGVLEALLERQLDNKAYHVEVSLYDAAVASLINQASNYLMEDHIPQAIGSLHPNIAPYGETFQTKDGRLITVAIGSDNQFKNLFEVLQIDLQDKFDSNKQRVQNRKEIAELLSTKIIHWESSELCQALIDQKVPVATINNLEQVFENQSAKDLILEDKIDGVNTKRVKTTVYKITSA